MATEQQPIQRQILTPSSNVQAGSGFESLGTAATQLATQVSNKLSDIAIEQASQEGAAAGARGDAPKSLAPGLTAATSAYNKGVVSAETNRIVESGRQQIEEAFIRNTDPANFTANSPAEFKAQVVGITQGTLENARPEERAKIQESLGSLSRQASMKMLSHSIAFENKKTVANFTLDIDKATQDRRNASLLGDEDEIFRIDTLLEETKQNYAAQNEQIKASMPKINQKLEQQKQVDDVLASYSHAVSNQTENEWRDNFSKNKDKIPADVWMEASKGIISIGNNAKALNLANNSQDVATLHRDINNGTISTQTQLGLSSANRDVTPAQFIKLQEFLDNKNAASYKDAKETITFKENIDKNRPTFNTGGMKDKQLNRAIKEHEGTTGKTANLLDMKEMITGESNISVSGLPGATGSSTPSRPLGSNVPEYDGLISRALTAPGNPLLAAQAASIANDMLYVQKGQASMLNISGQALAVATEYSHLIKAGMGAEEAVKLAQDTVLNTSESERKIRLDRYETTYKHAKWGFQPKINSLFQEAFNTKSSLAGNDPAMGVFANVFRDQYAKTGSEQSALKATKYIMRSWGTSRFYEDGIVSNNVPEKEINAANEAYALNNQIRVLLQTKINSNNIEIQVAETANKKPGVKVFVPAKIEWSGNSQAIDINNLSDTDKVLRPLGVVLDRKSLGVFVENARNLGAGGIPDDIAKAKPTIKVDGFESEVYLTTGPDTRLNQGGGLRYTLAYRDRHGIQNTIEDLGNNPQGVLQIAPQELNTWAPGMLNERNSEAIKAMAIKIKTQQLTQDLDRLGEGNKLEDLLLGPSVLSGHSPEYFALMDQIWNVKNISTEEIQKQLKIRMNPQQAITDADVVSVEATKAAPKVSSIPVVPDLKKNVSKSSIPSVPKLKEKEPEVKVSVIPPIPELGKTKAKQDSFFDKMANIESPGEGMKAESPTGAVGKYQFTKGTWSDLVKKHGKQTGITNKDRATSLDAQETMARLYAKDNIITLTSKLKRKPKEYEIFMAHNIGANGASKLIKEEARNPNGIVTAKGIGSKPQKNPLFFEDRSGKLITYGEALARYKKAFKGK